jgi:hypothetical protein
MLVKGEHCEKCGKPTMSGLTPTNYCEEHHAEVFQENLRNLYVMRKIHEACLASAKTMGPDKLKQMSWFGKNHK